MIFLDNVTFLAARTFIVCLQNFLEISKIAKYGFLENIFTNIAMLAISLKDKTQNNDYQCATYQACL